MIPRSHLRGLAVVVCLSLPLVSCATTDQRDQLFGSIAGAAAGAGIGALAGKGDTTAILAGAAAGAVVGWGAVKLMQYRSERTSSAKEEAKAFGYRESQGTVVKLRGASVEPASVSAGEEVAFEMDYAVLAPPGTKTVEVQETWELTKDGKTLSKVPPRTEKRQPGGWHSRASIQAPKNAEKGTYVVKNRVDAGTSYDERIAAFVVD